jgi:hypothetical protein
MQVAMVFVKVRGVRMAVCTAIRVGVFVRVGMIMAVFMLMSIDPGFALATAANGTHSQTPEIIRPTNP